MKFLLSLFVALSFPMVGCSPKDSNPHNFAENSDADFRFNSKADRDAIVTDLKKWASANGFKLEKPTTASKAEAYRVSLDSAEPKGYARLNCEIKDDLEGQFYYVHLYLKTDRWGDAKAHQKQKVITGKLHKDFVARFAGNM